MQKQASWRSYLFLALLAIVVCSVLGFTLYRGQMDTLFRSIEPSCNIGIATASITVQDWQANDICQAMLASKDNFTGHDWTKLGGTLVSAPASGSIMCEMDMQGIHLVVRDSLPASRNGIITCGILDGSVPSGVLPG